MLIHRWHRKLTHGYAAWCTYAAIGITYAGNNLPLVAEWLPSWLTIAILAAGLGLALVKQESVSGE